MPTARVIRAACLVLGLALLGAACSGRQQDAGNGVRGGTLEVLSEGPTVGLDTAGFTSVARAYARTLYGYNLSGAPEQRTVPVPDIASGPPQVSTDRRTYTFTLRPGVRYAPPVDREVAAWDFITAIQRLYDDKASPRQVRGPLCGWGQLRRPCGRLRPLQPAHLRPRPDRRAGPQSQPAPARPPAVPAAVG